MKVVETGKCFICGNKTEFTIDDASCLYREAICSHCGASKRNSDVAHSIVQTFIGKDDLALSEAVGDLQGLRIYETQAAGKLHDLLRTLPYYVCSEFHDSTPPGCVKGGVRCEDLQRLTFEENVFDLVISQDVFEHVADPIRAFREIARILKPGGYHIFTVPIHEKHNTVSRAILNETGIVQLMPAVYHGDPLRQGGSYVYTDFGEDIAANLNSIGMNTKITYYSRWYAPEEVTFINKQDEIYRRYLDANRNGRLADFFKYNSAVLVSRKIELPFTGERFLPHVSGEIAYEHLHRYAFASDFVSGKTVLDIASGEGYGSGLLAKNAKKVIGVDLSEETITHAKSKYASQGNLEFRLGSCINIPCENGTFDVVVSFETIEHHAEHEKMLDEIKRVLKPDGLLVISSPNKKTYTDDSGVKNEFHVKELYLKEFTDLLSKGFKFINILGQRLTFSSLIWPLEKNSLKGATHYFGDAFDISSSHSPNFEALYFVAVCSNSESIGNSGNQMSLFTEKSDLLFKNYNTFERQVQEKERQIQDLLNSLSWKITAPLRGVLDLLKKKDVKRSDNLPENDIKEIGIRPDIIIPVYNSYEHTTKCIESVLKNSKNCRLIIVNDASTDFRIKTFLESLKSVPEKNIEIFVLENKVNKGFVKTVNYAYEHAKNHFVILNSDTEVPAGWLDRLFAPIIENEELIASVTPFTNSGTICSFPDFCVDNAIYKNLTVDEIDGFFKRYGPKRNIEIPTGVGFCMAFNKKVVEKIGFFDDVAFDRGYGEENDWSLRASKNGFKNVMATNLFVYHKHGASFEDGIKKQLRKENTKKLLEKHPGYSMKVRFFIIRDPAKKIRNKIRKIIDNDRK